ncbi:MAG: protein kinase [Bacteroidales bacterium]|jgi:serine/threonine protein kinase|nr:protein kinase [Bacteroidales bacterium]MDY0314051.1 protein kinase [Bacteroidales bacterium]
MQAKILKGNEGSYLFFPEEKSSIISKSNYSIVYLTAKTDSKEKFVCKQFLPLLTPNQSARLKFFIETNIRLEHKGIAKIVDFIIEDGQVFIIQEYIYGLSLKDLIKSREYFDYRYNYFFYRIIAKFLDILSYFHSQNLCLCDVKPSNIMVCTSEDLEIDLKDPEVKLIDIELVKPSFKQAIPNYGGKSFSLMYASPEQILGFEELVGEHSDIFSTGLILYEAIAKETALNTSNPMFVKKIQTSVKLQKHYRFDEDLFKIIAKACVKPSFSLINKEQSEEEIKLAIIKSLSNRFQSAENFKTEILKLIL